MTPATQAALMYALNGPAKQLKPMSRGITKGGQRQHRPAMPVPMPSKPVANNACEDPPPPLSPTLLAELSKSKLACGRRVEKNSDVEAAAAAKFSRHMRARQLLQGLCFKCGSPHMRHSCDGSSAVLCPYGANAHLAAQKLGHACGLVCPPTVCDASVGWECSCCAYLRP
jgi:hypothetical protein